MASDTKVEEVPIEIKKLSTEQTNAEAREAIEIEHTLTFVDALKCYPKAIGWSMYFSLGVIMLCQSFLLLTFRLSPTLSLKELRRCSF
jgi:hypothetical protein